MDKKVVKPAKPRDLAEFGGATVLGGVAVGGEGGEPEAGVGAGGDGPEAGVGVLGWGAGVEGWGAGVLGWGEGEGWGVGVEGWGAGEDVWGVGVEGWGAGEDVWGAGEGEEDAALTLIIIFWPAEQWPVKLQMK